MTKYRWNTDETARAYDAAAEHIHPHYLEIQDEILQRLGRRSAATLLVVDAGGGSGRLMERVLELLPRAAGVGVERSEPYLALAGERLSRFGSRVMLLQYRLQDDWGNALPRPADAIVSMSAIHHLEPDEKRSLYAHCRECLTPGGVFYNGDEFRSESDENHLAELCRWAEHMQANLEVGLIPKAFTEMVAKWKQRNVDEFGSLKQSGDDCHETIDTQVGYLREAGFTRPSIEWRKEMWAIIAAER